MSSVPPRRSPALRPGGPWSPAGDVAAADPTIGAGPQASLELHQAPDLGPVDPNIGLNTWAAALWMAARSTPSSSAHCCSGAAIGWFRVGSQAGMPGGVNEQVFEQQWDEPGEHHGPDIDDD